MTYTAIATEHVFAFAAAQTLGAPIETEIGFNLSELRLRQKSVVKITMGVRDFVNV